MVEVNNSCNTLVADLGTNSLILTVLNYKGSYLNVEFERSVTTRIGETLHSDGNICEGAYIRTRTAILEALSEIKTRGVSFGADMGICTEALRAASNGNEIVKRTRSETKINFEVLSGKDEARFSYLGCAHYAKNYKTASIVDIGGGSTELNFVSGNSLSYSMSIPIGAVQLESLLGISKSPQSLEPARKMIDYSLALYNFSPDIIVFCGGTATTIANLKLRMDRYVPSTVEGLDIKLTDTAQILQELSSLKPEGIKKLLSYDPKRADIITAGACIMERIFNKFKPGKAVISTIGPRHGFYMERSGIRSISGIKYAEDKT